MNKIIQVQVQNRREMDIEHVTTKEACITENEDETL